MSLWTDMLITQLDVKDIFQMTRDLHASYDVFMSDGDVWGLLKEVIPNEMIPMVSPVAMSSSAHKVVSDLIMAFYPSERTVKYYLAKEHLAHEDEVTAFEVKIGNSRLDVGVINGHSYAYEIKTELDSLSKLEKQLNDYSRAFEYVNVVCHPCHLERVLAAAPSYCGVRTYTLGDVGCKFNTVRRAKRSPQLNHHIQVACLSSKELDALLRLRGYSSIPSTRDDREKLVHSRIPKTKINPLFKLQLKARFAQRWDHLRRNFEEINPVDVQDFFNSLQEPKWLYYKNSSIVYR